MYYKIELEEYATASFCSFTKSCVGDETSIKKFIEDGLKITGNSIYFMDMANAYNQYGEGIIDTKINIAHQDKVFLTEVKKICIKHTKQSNINFIHKNIYGYDYYIKADSVNNDILYIESNKKYYRCIKASFRNLQYGIDNKKYKKLEMIWGHPGVIYFDRDKTKNRIYFIEKEFKNKEELEKDIRNPSSINYTNFMNDIFADG